MKIDAKKIKQLMVRDGVKQKDVAERLGVHPTAFSFALSSGNTTQNIAMRLAVMFKVPFGEVVVNPNDVIINDPSNDPDLLKKIEDILDRKLNDRLAPLVEQMSKLNQLIEMANLALAKLRTDGLLG